MARLNKSKLVQSAQKHLSKGNLDKALKDYQKILQGDPDDLNVRLKLGELHERQGKRTDAVKEYQRVADAFTSGGFYSKAVAVLKRISAIDPGSIEVHLNLAELNQKLGLLSEVVHHYQRAADIYDRQGEKRKAVDILKKVAEVGPPNLERKLKVAELYFKEGFPEAAYEQFTEATSDLPQDSRELVELVNRMCKACPEDARMKRRLGELHLARGNPKAAKAILEEAVAMSRDGMTLELLSEIESQFNHPARARDLLEEAVGLYEAEENSAKARELSERLRELSAALLEEEPERRAEEEAASSSGEEAGPAEAEGPAEEEEPAGAESPAPPAAPDGFTEDRHLESALSEAEVYLKYNKPEGAVEILESLAETYPHRHEPPIRLKEILEASGDWGGVATQCRRLAAIAQKRDDSDRAARYTEEEKQALARLEPPPEGVEAPEPPVPSPSDEEDLPEETPAPVPETPALPTACEPEIVIEEEPPSPPAVPAEAATPVPGDVSPSVQRAPVSPGAAEDELLIRLDAFEDRAEPPQTPVSEPVQGGESWRDVEFVVEGEGAERSAAAEPGADRSPEEALAGESGEPKPSPQEVSKPEAEPAEEGPHAGAAPAGSPRDDAGAAPVSESDLEEAEFYASQGMIEEALAIYRRAVDASPGDSKVQERYEALLSQRPARRKKEKSAEFEGEEERGAGEDAVVVLEEPAEEAAWEWGAQGGPLEVSGSKEALPEPEPVLAASGADDTVPGPAASGDGVGAALPEAPAVAVPERGEEGFDLRAELEQDQESHEGAGSVSAATRELSNLVSELQVQEEEDASSAVDGQTHYDLGIAYKEMGLLEDAIRELRLAARDPGRKIDCFTVLGICHREQGRPEEAVRMIEACLADEDEAWERAPGIVYEMAAAQEETGNAGEAVKWFERVAEIDPEFRDVAERLSALRCSEASENDSSSPQDVPRPGDRRKGKKISYL
jgi:tetratricopeptide (TPR) repeat protein